MDNRIYRILVFPCGSEIGMEIWRALKNVKNVELFGAGSTNDHGKYVYKNYVKEIPHIDDEVFHEEMNRIIDKYNIDYIYPAHDAVVTKLSQIQDLLDIPVLVADNRTCNLARSKKETYKFLNKYDFIPKVYNTCKDIDKYPVFLKPDIGQGAQGTVLARNEKEVSFYLHKNPSLIISEYLPGNEFTVDCFTDKNGKLLFCGQRTRSRIKSGISVNSKTVSNSEEVVNIANILNSELKFKGAWFFQVKISNEKKYMLMEFAPRIAGTMELYRMCGINFPLLTLYVFLDQDVTIFNSVPKMELDRAFVNRYKYNHQKYENVYIDFDDTIIVKNKVNTEMMGFLYQSQNNNKKIFLITKHIHNIQKSLKRYNIDKNIFHEIIHLDKNDNKYKYITDKEKSIFIDDSFQERYEVYNHLKIPVFDLDCIDMLKDWRQ
jgi:Carbamoylphosphate synthase large subunit (split gene in MJ)